MDILPQLIIIFKKVIPDAKIDYALIDENTHIFNDICANSSTLIMVAFAIEKQFKITLPDFLQMRTITVGDAIKTIQSQLSKANHK
ncbi:MAG: hypothetical protein LBP70_02305 [Mycoplasmataceae bacterium]|jgi:acyl carrier protein|nr:hypothetical protein [Mycoplasmataceae bacterium]